MGLISSRDVPAFVGCTSYELARGGPGTSATTKRLLVPLDDSSPEAHIERGDFAFVPDALDDVEALWLPAVATALSVWQTVRLELGEAAVVSGGHALSELVGRAAVWHGAVPVIQFEGTAPIAGFEYVDGTTGDAAARIRALVAGSTGYAAVDLCGTARTIETLVATLPRWGRLHLVGATERFTIDFQEDINRRGASVTGGRFEPASLLSQHAAATALLARASRLMAREDVKRLTTGGQATPRF